jgi:hypothetical protein
MNTHPSETTVVADDKLQVEGPIVEVTVLLETWQLTALEAASRAHDVTAGELIRCLLRDYLACYEDQFRASCGRSDTLNPAKASGCLSSLR